MSEVVIRAPETPEEFEATTRVFLDQVALWGVDPTFAGIDQEIAGIRDTYAPPRGAVLMVLDTDGAILGAGAMRPLPGPGDCLLTAVVVTEEARGRGIGRLLMQALVARARAAGHQRMHHDVSIDDPQALALWQAAGFVPAPPYFPNPRPGSQHMVLDLTQFG